MAHDLFLSYSSKDKATAKQRWQIDLPHFKLNVK
jgi:hypothetical protein